MAQGVARVAWFPSDFGKYPVNIDPETGENKSEGPRSLRIEIDLTAGVGADVNLGQFLDPDVLSNVQCMKIDNADGLNPVTVVASVSKDRIVIPNASIGIVPFQFSSDRVLTITRADAGTLALYLYNMPYPLGVWATTRASAATPAAENLVQLNGVTLVADDAVAPATDYPLPTGGRAIAQATQKAYTAGDRAEQQYATTGEAIVMVRNGTGVLAILNSALTAVGVTLASFTGRVLTAAANYIYNGTSLDLETCPNLVARLISAANTTNATLVKNAAGKVHTIHVTNGAVISWLKFYNKASAPTVGTDTPFATYQLPANFSGDISFPNGGLYFSTGIGYAITLNGADADTTAVAAGATSGLNVHYS